MSQIVFNAAYTNFLNCIPGVYYTIRNQSVADYTYEGTDPWVGQDYSPISSKYQIDRLFVYFDTSGIPNDAIITAATLHFINGLYSDTPATNFNIIIRGASSASNPLVLGDYDLTHYNGDDLGELDNTTPITENDYSHFTLNVNGLAYINKGGITKFVLLSEKDIDNLPPTEQGLTETEKVQYEGRVDQNEVRLTIIYFDPTGIPVVETINLACEDRQSTTLTAVGDVTDISGGYTYRGFEYYEYTDAIYDSSMYAVREIGRFVAPGEFRMTLYGLKPSTVYWIRAFAGNVFGIAYGEWVLCSTLGVQVGTYDVYTEPNTAKYRLYVSDDEAIAWRGYKGPYSGKQTLINIKDITNLTKGMKVLKIDLPEAGKKGNFHVCITVKQELKG